MKKRLLNIYSEYFYPEMASTGQLMSELARGLSERGFDVRAITNQPNYQGHKGVELPKREVVDGVSIIRILATRFFKDNLALRLINWLSFSVSAFFYSIFKRRPDGEVSLFLSNPPILPLVGLLLRKLKGEKYVVLLHDIYPDMGVALDIVGENNLFARLWERANSRIYDNAEKVIVLGKGMRNTLLSKSVYSLSESDIAVIHNWEDPDFITPKSKSDNQFAKENGYVSKMVVLYSGNLGQHHDLETLIQAAGLVESLPIQFVFIGEGAQKAKLRHMVNSKNLENVDFHPYQPREKLPDTLTCGDISVVSEDKRAEGLCVSSKLYSSLAAGNAILGLVGSESDVAQVISEGDCGLRADQGDYKKLAEHLRHWLDNKEELEEMGRNARKHFERNFTLDRAVGNYAKLLQEVAEK